MTGDTTSSVPSFGLALRPLAIDFGSPEAGQGCIMGSGGGKVFALVGSVFAPTVPELVGPSAVSRRRRRGALGGDSPGGKLGRVSNGKGLGCPVGAANALGPFRVLPGAGGDIRGAMFTCARRDASTAVVFRLELS